MVLRCSAVVSQQPVQLLSVVLVLHFCFLDDFLHGVYKSFDLQVHSCPLWSYLSMLETKVICKCRKLFAVEQGAIIGPYDVWNTKF